MFTNVDGRQASVKPLGARGLARKVLYGPMRNVRFSLAHKHFLVDTRSCCHYTKHQELP